MMPSQNSFSDDSFVYYTRPKVKLGKKHRALVREHVARNQHQKFLSVGKPGLAHLSWRVVPGQSRPPSKVDLPNEESKAGRKRLTRPDHREDARCLLSRNILSGNMHDPFDALPIHCDGLDQSRTLSQIFQGYAPLVEYKSATQTGEIQYPLLDVLLPLAVHNADLLGALLLDVHCRARGLDHGHWWRSVLQYRGEALQNIREQLLISQKTGADVRESTILAMVFLHAVDSESKTLVREPMPSHAKALQTIVNSRGGLQSLSSFVRHFVLIYNFWLHRECSSLVMFPRHTYANEIQCVDQIRTSMHVRTELVLLDLPVLFVQSLQDHPVSDQFLDILRRAQDWSITLQKMWLREASPTDYQSFARADVFAILEDTDLLNSKMGRVSVAVGEGQMQHPQKNKLMVLVTILYLLNSILKESEPRAAGWVMYQEARAEAGGLLQSWLEQNCFFDSMLVQCSFHGVIIWSSLVVAESWRDAKDKIDIKGNSLMKSLLTSFPALRDFAILRSLVEQSLWYGGFLKGAEVCWREALKTEALAF